MEEQDQIECIFTYPRIGIKNGVHVRIQIYHLFVILSMDSVEPIFFSI